MAEQKGDEVLWTKLGKLPEMAGVAARGWHGMPVVYAQDLSWQTVLSGSSNHELKQTGGKIASKRRPELLRVNAKNAEMLVALQEVYFSTDKYLVCPHGEQRLIRLATDKPAIRFHTSVRTDESINNFIAGSVSMTFQQRNARKRFSGLCFSNGRLCLSASSKWWMVDPVENDGLQCFALKVAPFQSPNKVLCVW